MKGGREEKVVKEEKTKEERRHRREVKGGRHGDTNIEREGC